MPNETFLKLCRVAAKFKRENKSQLKLLSIEKRTLISLKTFEILIKTFVDFLFIYAFTLQRPLPSLSLEMILGT